MSAPINKLVALITSLFTFRWLRPAQPTNVAPFPSTSPTPLTSDELVAQTMQEAALVTDVHQTLMDKLVLGGWSFFAYFAPILVAGAAGIWIGDGYAGKFSFEGESFGVHIISIVGELALAMGAVVVAESIKKLANDKQVIKLLFLAVLVFLLSSVASASAQWFLILKDTSRAGYDPTQKGFTMMLVFRVLMPVVADIFSLLFLSIHGRHSLKQKLAQLDEKGEAFEKIHERKLRMQQREDKARQEREDADNAREARRKREEVLTKIEEMYGNAAIAQIE
ncbi:MAG: hypothetical protein ACJ788_24840, partial [Ktedonobacteraceae bacterium]